MVNCPKVTWNYPGNTQRQSYRPRQLMPQGRTLVPSMKEGKKP